MITDFEHVVENFIANLRELADHIEGNQHIVDFRRTAAQARTAAQMLEYANAFEGPPMPIEGQPEATAAWLEQYETEEEKAWSDAWAYVGANIRKWWA